MSYRLNVCVPNPKSHMLKPSRQCNGIWRWGPLGGD